MIRPYEPFTYSLASAAELLGAELINGGDITFTGMTHSDSDVQPGDLFLALPGARVHGADFIAEAKAAGAVAVLTDLAGAKKSRELPTLMVSHPREAAATLATSFYRAPVRDMQSIGITGTNGKTTVTTLLHQIFEKVGRESGLIGTVETRIGAERLKSERTTPEATDLQALAAIMRERHMRHLVMEVSSHALDLKRVMGSHFAIVGFTNLTQDHLDYHKDMESYFKAKARLFTHEYADLGFINIDNAYGERLFNESEISTISLSRHNPKATWHYTDVSATSTGYEFTVRGKDGVLIESRTPMHGGFNLDNVLLAVAIAYECDVDPLEIATVLPVITGAPGRLEPVSLGQNFTALVDYAHSPDAVKNVLSAVREFTTGRVIAVLGCGGDRDPGKRPLMGEALLSGSDISIFTSDNPRSEVPATIIAQMVGALSLSDDSKVIEDRAAAIAYAISLATAGDTVIVLGKGHEVGQEIAGVMTPFDDRLHVAQAIEGRK
jgi:UDP-N-acetylmuramoyl-L-alanyl-D-glutamate--2,6-diaminopimelate ligase